MAIFFIYSLKVAVCLTAFYLVYKLLLSRDSYYRFNHALLLTLVFASLVVPTIRLTLADDAVLHKGIVMMEEAVVVGETLPIVETDRSLSVVQLLFLIYIIGVLAFLLINILSVWHIVRLMKNAIMRQGDDGMEVMVVEENVSPFSWFGNVVMSRKDYETCFAEILIHEREHARMGHSYEVILCNLLIVFQWYNPAAWLLKRELQDIHEYEADAAVLREGIDAKQYQMLLIMKSVGERAFLLANNLNHNSLKKRIKMMKTKKTNKWLCLKALAVLPIAACAVVAFANPAVEQATKDIESSVDETLVVAETKTHGMPFPQVKGNNVVEGDSSFHVKGKSEDVIQVVEEMPSFPGGTQAMFNFLRENIRYPETAQKNKVQGRVIVSFVIDKEGNIVEQSILNSVSSELDKEALRVISAMPKWKPGKLKGKAVSVKYALPVTFQLYGGSENKPTADIENAEAANAANQTTPAEINSEKKTESVVVRAGSLGKPEDIYYSIDGKAVDHTVIESIDPSTIESINVVKDKASLEKIGAKDKSGAVLIKLKK